VTTARYSLAIFSPDGESTAEASVDAASGSSVVEQWQGVRPPEWLEALARSLLRTIVRNKLSDGEWPRRITRWRPEPRS
jgi:hypothetical protein